MVTRGVDQCPEAGEAGDVHGRGIGGHGLGVVGPGREVEGLGRGVGDRDQEDGTRDPEISGRDHVAADQEVIGQGHIQDPGPDLLNHFQGRGHTVHGQGRLRCRGRDPTPGRHQNRDPGHHWLSPSSL